MLWSLLAIQTSPAQQATDRKTELGRPTPQAMRIQVVRGETVRITLAAETKSQTSPIEYLVRDFPTLGILGELLPVPEDRGKATIVYQAASQSEGKTDVFSFSTRYPGGYYSAPAQVIIELSDPEPLIETQSLVDFGSLVLGDEATRELLVKNSGNIEYRKHIELPPPLELIEPANGILFIPPGSDTMLKIKFRPEKVGAFKQSYAFHNKPALTFIGTTTAPFTANTKKLTLPWNQEALNREGKIELANLTGETVSVKIHKPFRVQCLTANPLAIAAGKTAVLRIALPKEDVQSFKGSLAIISKNHTLTIPVEAGPTPPHISIDLPSPSLKRIDFGTANPGETVGRTFLVKNTGGTGCVIRLGVFPPFRIARDPSDGKSAPYSIGPESSAALTVDFVAPSKQSGLYTDTLEINSDGGAFSIPLTALVNNPNPMAGQTPIPPSAKMDSAGSPLDPPANAPIATTLPPPSPLPPLPDPDKGEDHRSPTGFYTRDFVAREYSVDIPVPSKFKAYKVARHELTLAWEIPSPDHTVFEMDMRQMIMNPANYAIESVWVPFHDIEFERSQGMVYATIKGLHPASIYEFRVFTTGPGNKYSRPSEPFGVWTKAPPDYRWVKWLLWVVGFSLVALLVWLYWKKHDGRIPMPTYWPRRIHWPFE
jgi:hypothetical protein